MGQMPAGTFSTISCLAELSLGTANSPAVCFLTSSGDRTPSLTQRWREVGRWSPVTGRPEPGRGSCSGGKEGEELWAGLGPTHLWEQS